MFGINEKSNENNISIWCEGVQPHADMKAGSKVVYTTITGKDENNEYTWTQFSSFVGSFDQAGIQNAVDSLLIQETHMILQLHLKTFVYIYLWPL